MMTKLVSIVIPTFGRRKEVLLNAIESINRQEYTNIEIIIVNDNHERSQYKDEIRRFISEYNSNFRISYYENSENIGGALSRNIGIEYAEGEYITFLDDDDIYLPLKIKNQVNFMELYDLDLSITNLVIHDENDNLVDFREFRNVDFSNQEKLLNYHLKYHITGTPTFMFKSTKIREIGGFDDAIMGQEFYLMYKALVNNLKISYLNDSNVVAYRHAGDRISTGVNKVEGEKILFEFKTKHFDKLSKSEIRYVKFRHYLVLMVTYRNNRNGGLFFYYAILIILFHPFTLLKEIKKHYTKISRIKRGA